MATHSTNNQPNTIISDSVVSIDTLNVNKTSTEQAVLQLLPQYHLIDTSTIPLNYTFDLNPQVNYDFSNLFKVFIDGVLIPTASTINDNGVYLYPTGLQFIINGSVYQNLILPTSLMHALYTKI
jgi:hypothetical protein